MSLPSSSTVLRGILPGSPLDAGHGGGHPAAGATGAGVSTSAAAEGQSPSHQDLALTPEAASQRPETSGEYRRTREKLDVMSKIDSPGGRRPATYGAGGVGRDVLSLLFSSDDEDGAWDGCDHYGGGGPPSGAYEAGMQQHLRGGGGAGAAGVSSSVGGVLGGSAHGLSSGCTSKRAKLTSHSLSRLSDKPVNGTGIMKDSDVGNTGGGAHARGGPLVRSTTAVDGQRSFEQFMSYSTEEWCPISKALRIMGADSLKELNIEDARRASYDKAARVLGVYPAEPQHKATATREERLEWYGRDPGGKGGSGSGSKPKLRQGGISSLVRDQEFDGSSQAVSSENGDCSSLNYNSSEDLMHKKGRGKQEMGSNRSTRATETCSSVSDLAHMDPDGLRYRGGSSRGATSVAGQDQAHQEQQQEQQQHTR